MQLKKEDLEKVNSKSNYKPRWFQKKIIILRKKIMD